MTGEIHVALPFKTRSASHYHWWLPMSKISPTAVRAVICLLCLCSQTGCLRRLGLHHSSLTPRTAQLERDRQIIRSQDSDDSSARLLRPDFGSGEEQAEAGQESGIIIEPAKSGTSGNRSASTSGRTGHSLELTAEKLREIMNARSRNDMSEGEVLSDREARWEILERGESAIARLPAGSGVQRERVVTVGHASAPREASVPANPETLRGERHAEESEVDKPFEETPSTTPEPAADRSVLARLRGINETIGDTRSRWRIPSPWDVFREREQESTQPQNPESPLPTAVPPSIETTPQTPAIADSELLKQLIAEATTQLQQWPREASGRPVNRDEMLRLEQDLKLLNLIANLPEAALYESGNASEKDEEFWRELLLALAIYRGANGSTDSQQVSNTIDQLKSAIRELVPSSSLRIRRMDLCSEIHSFGRIETFASNSFVASDPILLYVELENFSSQTTANGEWRTQFDAELKFMDAEGEVIETREVPDISDESSSERSDYYLSFELNIPSHLQRGDYRIELRLQDRQTRRTAAGDVKFRIR